MTLSLPALGAAVALTALVIGLIVFVRFNWPSALERQIAARYLRSRRRSRLLSLIAVIAVGGVTVGVMALVIVLGVMNGLQSDLREKILTINPHLRVLTYDRGLRLDNWRRVLDTVRQVPGVDAAAPFVMTQAMISAGADYTEGVVIVGIDPDTGARSVTTLPHRFTRGDLRFKPVRTDVEGGVVLGARLASKLSTYPGEMITLISPAGSKFNASVGAFVPKFRRFEVTGLFETGMYEYDNNWIAMRRDVAQSFAGLDTAVTGLEVRLTHPETARTFGQALEARLGYPYRSLDWQTQNRSLFSALKLEKLAMGLVVFLICLVAAFNVVGVLSMVVRDKTREIGILMAMGLRRAGVRRVFLTQGIMIGIVGTVVGAVLGFVLGGMVDRGQLIPIDASIYFIDHLPVRIDPFDAVLVIAASLVIATLAPLYPAIQASRMDPVPAIRYE
jgi:lipoprotein-releasing system permease protein